MTDTSKEAIAARVSNSAEPAPKPIRRRRGMSDLAEETVDAAMAAYEDVYHAQYMSNGATVHNHHEAMRDAILAALRAHAEDVQAMKSERDRLAGELVEAKSDAAEFVERLRHCSAALDGTRDGAAILRDENTTLTADLAAARKTIAGMREAAKDAIPSLAAAISLLRRGGKKAAPSDKMFEQMLLDYEVALERTRAALAQANETTEINPKPGWLLRDVRAAHARLEPDPTPPREDRAALNPQEASHD